MKTITTTAVIGPDRVLTVQLPPDVPPGRHEVVVVVNGVPAAPPPGPSLANWPRHDDVAWPADLSLRREDLYGDDGR
jgi:hypothetical protein